MGNLLRVDGLEKNRIMMNCRACNSSVFSGLMGSIRLWVVGVVLVGLSALPAWGQVIGYLQMSDGTVTELTAENRDKVFGVSGKQIVSRTFSGITWNFDYVDDAGTGFNDTVLGSPRQATLELAAEYISSVLHESGGVVDVNISTFNDSGTSTLASAGPTLIGTPDEGVINNGSAFEHILDGAIDPSVAGPTDFPDMRVRVNIANSFTLAGRATSSGEFDLLSILIHEITHGLGFLRGISFAEGPGEACDAAANEPRPDGTGVWGTSPDNYSTLGMLLNTGNGGNFISDSFTFVGQTSFFTGGDNGVIFTGANANAVFGSVPPIYAPSTFECGSSLSHWALNIVPGESAVMEPSFSPQELARQYQDFEIAALVDIGYPNAALPDDADVVAPIITRTGGSTATVECGMAFDPLSGVTSSDDVDGDISASIVEGGDFVLTGTPGTYEVTFNVRDFAGNDATQFVLNVTVIDTTAPTITLGGSPSVTMVENAAYLDAGATANDGCEGDLTESIVTVGASIDTSAAGEFSVTYNVSDSAGNVATQVTRTVIVEMDAVPSITLLGGTETLACGSVFVEPGFSASDAEDGNITGSVVVGGSVDTSTPGTYVLTYDVSDSSGNEAAQQTRSVIVQDTAAPTLIGVAGDTTLECGDSFTEGTVTAFDSCEGDVSARIVVGGDTVDVTTPGTYVITYDVQNSRGNAAVQQTRSVFVQDGQAPTWSSVPGDTTIACGDSFSNSDATALAGCEGDVSASIVVGGDAVDASTPGTYVITYDVADSAGNAAARHTRTVIVEDSGLPVITLLGADSITLVVGDAYADAGATASDECEGDLCSSIATSGLPISTTTSGAFTVTYGVEDSSGNAAVVESRTVTVVTTLLDTAQTLYDGIDEQGGGPEETLTFAEAQVILAGLTLAEFTRLDLNGDGLLSTTELMDPGAKRPKRGCFGLFKSNKGVLGIKDFLGDIFLLGLLSMVFVGWRAVGIRP